MLPSIIGVIEWPPEAGEGPDLIAAATLEELDRAFVARLRDMIGDTPRPGSDDELFDYVRDVGWPPDDATDADVLAWLVAMRTELCSTCLTVYHYTGEHLLDPDNRYA